MKGFCDAEFLWMLVRKFCILSTKLTNNPVIGYLWLQSAVDVLSCTLAGISTFFGSDSFYCPQIERFPLVFIDGGA